MSKTLSEHAKAYRERKKARYAKMEEALKEIYFFDVADPLNDDAQKMCMIARGALGSEKTP